MALRIKGIAMLIKQFLIIGAMLLTATLTTVRSARSTENLALGRPYVLSHPPNYPFCSDDGDTTDITDGQKYDPQGTTLWTQKRAVGWAVGEQYKHIEIDLGEIAEIEEITFQTAANAQTQGTFPLSVMVFLSDDGHSYQFAGELINESVDQSDYVVHTFKLQDIEKQARHVRLQTVRGGYYVFVTEVEVFGTRNPQLQKTNHPLAMSEILGFVKTRAPVLRQNNSSRTLLAHALEQVERSRQDQPAATAAATLQLNHLTNALTARTTAEEIDFHRGVPFTTLDRQICRQMGTFLQATNAAPLTIAAVNPWAPHLPFLVDTPAPTSQTPHWMHGEWGELAFNLTNGTPQEYSLTVALSGISPTAVKIHEVVFVEAFGFRTVADALMPLNHELELPPGMTKQIWLSVNTRQLSPKTYTGTLQVMGKGFDIQQHFSFAIDPVSMPEQASLDVNVFSYLHLPVGVADPAGMAADLKTHYVNNQTLISPYLPQPRVNAAGDSIGPLDFSRMDAYMAKLPHTKRWTLWTGFEWDHRQMCPRPDEPRREKIFSQWLREVIAHMKSQGYGYDEFNFLWIDEPNQEKMETIVKPASEVLRAVDPNVQVWLDITSDNTEESIANYQPHVDIWCAATDKLDWNFWQGKHLWHYGSSSEKSRSPAGHYRIKPWVCLANGASGNAFWTYTDGLDCWDDYAETPSYGVVYDGPEGLISSKRWDAYRAGIEDYELCVLLKAAISAAQNEGNGNSATAATALESWTAKVLQARHDPAVAEEAHQALLQHLLRISPAN